jgi:hypothetical protein
MFKKQTMMAYASAMALLSLSAEAAIVEDGLWTDNDWYMDKYKMGVKNGVPYSNDPMVQRRLTAPLSFDGDIDDIYEDFPNVQRIKSLFSAQ